jgi:PAS domain S-box-containing protein
LVDHGQRQHAGDTVAGEPLLQAVLDQMPAGVSVVEAPSGRLLFHNDEAVRMLGHPLVNAAERPGHARYGAIHADGSPYAAGEYPIARALTGEVIREEELLYRRGDGELIVLAVSAVPVRDGTGRIVRAVSTYRDISRQKRQERTLQGLNAMLEGLVEQRTRRFREEQERFRSVSDSGVMGIVCFEPGGVLTDANDAFLALMRMRREELDSGRIAWDDFTPPEWIPRTRTLLQGFHQQGRVEPYEREFLRRDGTRFWGLVGAARLQSSGQCVAFLLDITPRKQAEHAVAESERFHRFAVELAGIGTWDLDLGAEQCCLSPQMAQMLGLPADQTVLTPAEWRGAVVAEDLPRVEAALIDALRTGGTFDCTFRIVRPDGEQRWVYSRGGSRQNQVPGPSQRLHGASIDVTDRKAAEDALRETRDQLALAKESSGLGFGYWDMASGATQWDARARQLLDLPGQGPVPLDAWFERVHPDDWEDFYAGLKAALAVGGSFELHYRVVHRNGDLRWLHGTGTFKRSPDGRVVGATGYVRDVTEQRRADQRLREMATRLTRAEQEERRRISQILHDDLAQTLYGVEIKLDMIRQELRQPGAPQLGVDLEDARAWLDLAIAKAQQLTVDLSPPLLEQEGLTDALEWLQGQMQELHGLEVIIQAPHSVYVGDDDVRVLLFQTVRGLLFNVREHAGVDSARVRLEEQGDDLVIEVSDAGCGFDPSSPAAQGSGLQSARERLQLLGGQLGIDAAPGRGTRVVAQVPLALIRPSPPPDSPASAGRADGVPDVCGRPGS